MEEERGVRRTSQIVRRECDRCALGCADYDMYAVVVCSDVNEYKIIYPQIHTVFLK